MSIKVKDIVVNILDASRVGQYVEQYDVRILPEMVTDRKYAEVMYVDEDGAVITKEFGPYAYPADALRLATDEEKEAYEIERYTVTTKYKGEDFTFPMPVAKSLVDAGIHLGKDNSDANEAVMRFVRDSWTTILRGQDESKLVLLQECYEVYKKRVDSGRGSGAMEYIVRLVHEKNRNNDFLVNFVEALYEKPVRERGFYEMIEREGFEIPAAYVEKIKEVSGYKAAALYKGTDLYDYLKETRYYNSSFPHYKQLKVTKRGVNHLFTLGWGRSDTKRILERLDLPMDVLKTVLMNPNRDFSIDVDVWFKSLPWEEIIANADMFESSLTSSWSIKRRLGNGKYVAPDYAVNMFTSTGSVNDLINCSNRDVKNKSELKLKEMVAFLEGLGDDVTLEDLNREGKDEVLTGVIATETVRAGVISSDSIDWGDVVVSPAPMRTTF